MRSLLLALALFVVQGNQPQAPASIEGVVIRAGTSTPVVRARVSIGTAQTLTDEGGKFSVRNVPPGRYRVIVTHNSYLSAQYGERSRGGAGTEVNVGPGQAMKDIVIGLTPKGAISGRVYDRYGDPVVNATVQALKYTYQDGRRILVPADNARTNDLGEYRLFWLSPGPYVISALPQESACADGPCSVLIETRNAISGPAPVIGGAVRLDRRVAVPVADTSETSQLPVYYPGTTDAASATPIDLPPGINFTGVDLQITESRAVRVLGRVVNGVNGQPILPAAVTLTPRRGTIATGSTQRATISNRGIFEFRHMAPGSYDIVATASNGTGERLAGAAAIEIAGADIDSVTLVLQPQLSIKGRIIFENLQTDPANLNLNGIRVELRRESYTPELLVLLPTIATDGTFTLSGVTPGDYRLRVTTGGLKGYVKAARYGAIGALNPPFHIDGPGQFEIVIGMNSGSLDATVFDDAKKPFNDATVVLVPDPPRRQRFDLYSAAASDPSGHVHFDSLAPGDYRIFAWDDVPADAWQDMDFMRAYEDRGRPVRIQEGSQGSVELQMIRRP